MRKISAILAVAMLAVLPINGEDRPDERFMPAIALVEDGAQKVRCAKAAVAIERWSKRLKVNNWDISLVCDEYGPMPGAYGVTEYHENTMKARIWINVKLDRDPEEIAIHELLHLVIQDAKASSMNEERAVWTVAGLLFEGRGAIK